MKKIQFLFLFLLVSMVSFGAKDRTDLAVTNIADSLKTNAFAIVRNYSITFEYKSATSAIESRVEEITILNNKGADFADFECAGDKFRELKSFSGKLFDANGILLRKFSMSEVKTTEYSADLANDNKYYYLNIDIPTYPVTIVFEYDVNWKNGILTFPSFHPQYSFNLSVEKADYKLILPEETQYLSKAINLNNTPEKSVVKGIASYSWNVKNLCAVESEKFSPELDTFVSLLYLNPLKFVYDGVDGKITNWNEMGKWEYGLIAGRDILPDDLKKRILEMTKDAASDREKVKILYDYLGKTTRYVSIQLGIGGLQPTSASEVNKTGFSDCKGLSNYMKALLSAVGINSYYTIIRHDRRKKNIFRDYSNFYQMNHIILQVPLPNDTLWLECTNTRVPFGFIHNDISGHNAIVVSEKGGEFVRLPDYPDSLNVEVNRVNVLLNQDGSAGVTMNKKCKMKIYDDYDWFPLAKANEQVDHLREEIKLPTATIGVVKIKEEKSVSPNLDVDYTWSTDLYGTKTGNRLFIPVNPYRSIYEGLKKSKRLHDINIHAGYKDVDSIFIKIPDGYEIESMPSTQIINTMFGSFQSSVDATDKGIVIHHNLFMPSGTYKVSNYPDFVAFFEKVSTIYKSKIILRKRVV